MLDMLHSNFLKSCQVLGVQVRIFFPFIQTFLGKQKLNLFSAQTTNKSIFKQVGKGAKGWDGMGQCSNEIVDYKCLVLPNP
jgi:hypothetical protein